MDDSRPVEGRTLATSCFEGSGEDEEETSFEAEWTFPDLTKDSLLVGRFCGGNCISRSVFQMSSLAIVRQRRRRFPRACRLCSSRRRRSIISPGELARFRRISRPFAPQEAANLRVLESLRQQFGPFFGDYRHNLVVGKRISSDGAQGEIRAATWICDDGCAYDVVVKVLNHQDEGFGALLSQGMLVRMAELGFDSYAFHGATLIYKATLLRDGRIGLVMRRYSCNLRDLIQRRIQRRTRRAHSPFERHEVLHLLLEVAKGMCLLHSNGVVHRDLNPANVLVLESSDPPRCYVADFECNNGITGTGFFTSPEVLRMRDAAGVSYQRHSDIYCFAMTSYEICTGLVPLMNLRRNNYEFVLEGRRPELPDTIAPDVRALIERCWHHEPSLRPTFDTIVQELDAMMRS